MDLTSDPKVLSLITGERLDMDPKDLEKFISDYLDLQVFYRCAIREVSTRLEILDDEFQILHQRNPIHVIQTRLKTPQSVLEKVGRRNLFPNIDIVQKELTDIAGIRVICSYVDDIYLIAELLCDQPDVELVRAYDYIRRPKINGYRSLHMVITVPVHLSDGAHRVPVEIQIRTIAMDFWASLEHDLRYKSKTDIPKDVAKELRECSDSISDLDSRMQAIHRRLGEGVVDKGAKTKEPEKDCAVAK